ncbi:MAG: hypothetical protein WCH04_12985 [Gammaproteobacteria bacterium]
MVTLRIRNILRAATPVIFCGSAGGQPATTSQKVLTLAGAKQVIAAAVTEVDRLKTPGGSIAVVDADGHLIALATREGNL